MIIHPSLKIDDQPGLLRSGFNSPWFIIVMMSTSLKKTLGFLFLGFVFVALIFTVGYIGAHKLQDRLPIFIPDSDHGPPFDNFSSFLQAHPHIKATQVVAEAPTIWTFDNFLNKAEIDHLMMFSSFMVYSRVTGSGTSMARFWGVRASYRTSSSAIIPPAMTQVIRNVERRIRDLTGVPWFYGEPMQLVRYRPGEFYLPHHDFFAESQTGALRRGGNRIATALMYLCNVTKGGDTSFPSLKKSEGRFDDRGGGEDEPARVKAVQGRLLLWYNLNPVTLRRDLRTLHSGDPVIEGEKYIVTRWLHRKLFLPF